jgi:hypothetical protein
MKASRLGLCATINRSGAREHAMFDSFECQCIYVEIRNEAEPLAGRVEYRARSCAVCQARAALLRGDTEAIVAFEPSAPRYQRMH